MCKTLSLSICNCNLVQATYMKYIFKKDIIKWQEVPVSTMRAQRTEGKKGKKNYRKFQGKRKKKQMFFGIWLWSSDAFHCVTIFGCHHFPVVCRNLHQYRPLQPTLAPEDCSVYFVLFYMHRKQDTTLLTGEKKCYFNLIYLFLLIPFFALVFIKFCEVRQYLQRCSNTEVCSSTSHQLR